MEDGPGGSTSQAVSTAVQQQQHGASAAAGLLAAVRRSVGGGGKKGGQKGGKGGRQSRSRTKSGADGTSVTHASRRVLYHALQPAVEWLQQASQVRCGAAVS